MERHPEVNHVDLEVFPERELNVDALIVYQGKGV